MYLLKYNMLKKNFFLIEDFENIDEKNYRNRTFASHFFHSIEWMKIVKQSLNIRYKIAMLKENDQIVASIPFVNFFNFIKGNCALPLHFSGYYDSIVADDLNQKQKILFQFLNHCKKEKKYTQVPEILPIEGHQSFLGYSVYKIKLDIKLSAEEQVLKVASKRMSSYIKSAIKSNLTCVKGGLKFMNKFYPLYLQNMKEVGSPPLPKIFFEKILEYIPYKSKIILIEDNGKVCSGMFLLKVSESELFAPTICTPRLYQSSQSSQLIYLEAIKEAKKLGCSFMNFGRSIDGSGPALFKKRYGLTAIPLLIFTQTKNWSLTNPKNSIYLKILVSVWKKLPISITKLLSKFFSKHLI